MKSFLKFLSRNKLYTAIEAAGLIVSLAFVIIIGTSIRDQLGIVNNVPDHENLYLVGAYNGSTIAEYRMNEQLSTLPEIKRLAAFIVSPSLMQVNGENHYQNTAIMDGSLLDIIPLKVRSGSDTPFAGGQGVAITESAARRFFPDRNPVGETVGFMESPLDEEAVPATITAVIEDPDYTILGDFDFAVDIQSRACFTAIEKRESNVRANGFGTMVFFFAQTFPGVQAETFDRKVNSLSGWLKNSDEASVTIPYDKLYYWPASFVSLRQGKRLYFSILVVLVLLLLLSAILTYINLSFAVTWQRAKEMATRRLVGEDRGGIFKHVLGESLVFTLVCFSLAVLLAFWLAPVLDSLRPTGLNVPFRLHLDAPFWLMSAVLVLVVGLLAGTVPAAACASFRPLDVVSGEVRRKRKMSLGRICIVFQSTMAVLLTVFAIMLGSQLRFLDRADLGVDMQDDLYFFETPLGENEDFMALLTDKLRSSPMVREIGYADAYPTYMRNFSMGKGVTMSPIKCDSTAFKMLGFRIKELYGEIPGSLMLSESAANALGINKDNATVDNIYPDSFYLRYYPSSVGGVVEDFRKTPVNYNGMIPMDAVPTVEVTNAGVVPKGCDGVLMRTSPDHRAFEEWFRPAVNAIHEEMIGMPDIFEMYDMGVRGGYVEDLIAADHEDMRRYMRLVWYFCLVSILMAMLALLAMSTFYARTNSKGIAIRKVFGSTIGSETHRGVLTYMLWVGIAMLIAIPLAVYVCNRFLQSYPEHIMGYWWIFVLAVLLTVALSFASVLWQTLKAARTNPAVELKKE